MNVRGNRVRWRTLRNRRFRDRVVEAATSMTNVENNTTLLCSECGGKQLAVLDDIGEVAREIWETRIAVRENVARSQQVENLRHQLARLDATDVAHHFHAIVHGVHRADVFLP